MARQSVTQLTVHPFAQILPALRPEEFSRLEADVLAHGFRDPITLYQGQILDGRHRCAIAAKYPDGPQPTVRTLDGDDLAAVAFVRSGVAGRHLTDGQRLGVELMFEEVVARLRSAAKERQVAAGAAGAEHGHKGAAHGAKGGRGRKSTNPPCGKSATRGVSGKQAAPKTRDVLAELAGTSPRTAQAVMTLQGEAPDLFAEVLAGTISADKGIKEHKRRKQDATRKQAAETAAEVVASISDDGRIRHGDMATVFDDVPDTSVPLIFTDPPYHDKYLHLYDALGELAQRILIDGGSLITYTSHHMLPVVIDKLTRAGLTFFWPLAVVHTGPPARMTEYGIIVKHKPLLWFVKGKFRDRAHMTFVDDTVISQREKADHPWQQSVIEARYYIEQLTQPGELVVDPFCGGATTAVAACQAGRAWVTCDVDADTVTLARKRLHDERAA